MDPAVVKTESSGSVDVDFDETKSEQKDFSSFNNMSTSIESTSDDNINNGEWVESENGEMRQLHYRMVFDTREKKLQDKIEFVKIVCKYKNQLFGDCDGHEVTPRSKEDAWKKVASEVKGLGLESYRGKPWARLRDHDWQYVRRHALSRSENATRPTGKLGELDRIVLEVISTTALTNAVSQATSSSMFISQGSTNSQNSLQSTDSVEQLLRGFLGSVNQDNSLEIPEIGNSSFELRDELIGSSKSSSSRNEDPVVINTSGTNTSAEILDMLHKVTQNGPTTCLSMDDALLAAKTAINKSPIPKKITSRSATAPSVYAITSSTSPQQVINSCSSPSSYSVGIPHPPPIKRPRIELERSPTSMTITQTYEQEREALFLRKIELEVRQVELQNEKLEKEIRLLEGNERRAAELHAIEMRAAKAKLYRGSAIDEPSIDEPVESSNRVLVRQPNGFNF